MRKRKRKTGAIPNTLACLMTKKTVVYYIPRSGQRKMTLTRISLTGGMESISTLTVNALSTINVSKWAVDTGASQHFCNDLSVL